jgi:uncharacterized repeat protein (TIGR01451 family)
MKRRGWLWLIPLILLLGGAGGLPHWIAQARPCDQTPTDTERMATAPFERSASSLGATPFHTVTVSIPTYPYAAHLTPVFTPTYNITYTVLNWATYEASGPTALSRDYQLLVLENDHLEVTVLPELGGRVYQMVAKASGSNALYQNPVIKPTPWGPPEQGWWLGVGGIEWCLPVEEHGYEWGEPWAWSVVTSTAGVTVTVRDTDAADRLRATVDLFLPADRAYLAVAPHLENPTGEDISYEFWLNAALAPGPQNQPTAGLEFIFNADEMSVHSTGDGRLPGAWTTPTGPDYRFGWPVHGGTDFSRLGSWREWLGFFEYPQAAADFMGLYNHDADEGVVRVFPSAVARGAKGFAFGWSNPIDWHNWTDDGSGYVELHGGVAPTFWDTAVLTAGTALSWTEAWYPVGPIGALSAATAEAALGAREGEGRFHIGVHSTAARAVGETALYVWDRGTCEMLTRQDLPAVGPASPFLTSVPSGGRSLDQATIAYMDEEQNLLAAVNPTDCLPPQAQVDPLPSWVATTTPTITWSGEDVWTGIAAYDVQVRDSYEGGWTDWVTGTTATSAVFTATHGHTYFFRARARDAVGNQGAFGSEEWGQAFTTVLTETAPVLVVSRKAAQPLLFNPDQAVSYTVAISNTGNLTATAALTDTPPASMVVLTGTLEATSGAAPAYAGGAIRWAGSVPPGGGVRVTYALFSTATTPFMTPLTNTAEIAGSVLGLFTRRETVVQAHIVQLPLVTRGWPPWRGDASPELAAVRGWR